MKTVIGIDVGGSATKIVGYRDGKLLDPMFVKANDPLTSAYGAFGKFLAENKMGLEDIESIRTTGVGSSYLPDNIYGLKTVNVNEFECIAKGGMYLTGLSKAIVVSMGTGTAMVRCSDGKISYLGGTGVGGGTLTGLSRALIGMDSVANISKLAESGDLTKVDLRVSAITQKNMAGLPSDITAANFANFDGTASKADIAAGIINLVLETIAMLSIFNARAAEIDDIVLTGALTEISQAQTASYNFSRWFNKNFIIPERARFATVIGAALPENK